MSKAVTATEAVRGFADLIDHVNRTGEVVVVTRRGRPVCEIVPPRQGRGSTWGELVRFLTDAGAPDEDFAADVRRGVRAGNRPVLLRDPWDD